MKVKPKKKSAPKRKAAPKPRLSLTYRMRAQGFTGAWRWSSLRCECGERVATDGRTHWCVSCEEWPD